ncbi:alkaline phosphatase D family protein [Dermatobacter hominis]|uniref:alkaline phosphatase D family protein n=1 Tax=Dermatobacter hominis TaxID=2884263 RepID=UPI001D10A91B|nr:alkaline phosphatase D family protein [Dermatobacter hominis]UDY36317.1 alkaline phosphatase D family protein [Dermatobacter hominis]
MAAGIGVGGRTAAGADGPAVRSDEVFTHGVASFDPADRRIILWTRAVGVDRVTWHIEPIGGPAPTTTSGTLEVDGDHGCVHVDVDGLAPGTPYRYWFTAGPVRSSVGRTRTLPAGAATWWTVGLLCCADHSINHLSVHRALAEADIEVVLHLGDYIYETSGKGERELEPDHDCVTVDDYDRRYGQVRRDPATRQLHEAHPMIAIWDDHDLADNAWRGGAKGHDPDEHGPWSDRALAAAVARQRWLPARLPDPDDVTRLWRSFRVGDLAELVVLDTRFEGRDQQAGDDGAKAVDDPDRSLLGGSQRRWTEERLRDRTSRWCILATQVVLSPMRLPVGAGGSLLDGAPSGYGIVDGDAVCTDEWDGYPAERHRVARWLADRGGDALIVSGDVHSAWVFDGELSPGVRAIAPEFVCPGVSSTPLGRQLPRGWRRVADEIADDDVAGAVWSDLEMWGFVTLEVARTSIVGRWFAVDARDPDAPAELRATWAVDAGEPGTVRQVGPIHDVAVDRDARWSPGRIAATAGAGVAALAVVAAVVGVRWRRTV